MNEWCPVKHNIFKIKTKPTNMRKMPHFSNKSISKITYAQWLSRVWLFCHPVDYSAPGSSVHGIFPTRILKWVAILGAPPNPGIKPTSPVSPALQADSLPLESWKNFEVDTEKINVKEKNELLSTLNHLDIQVISCSSWFVKILFLPPWSLTSHKD